MTILFPQQAGMRSPLFFEGGNSGVMGVPVAMTDAQIATGNAFLTSELEKRRNIILEPLSSVTYDRDMPIETGGGWVESSSTFSMSYGLTGGSGDGPIQAGGSDAYPVIQANPSKDTYKFHIYGVSLAIMYIDMQKANFVGRPLERMLQEGVRLAYDKHMDENVYLGYERYGSTGLLNNGNVVAMNAPVGSGGSSDWASKTEQEILDDVNLAINTAWANSEYDNDAMVNHILLPPAQWRLISERMVTNMAGKSILNYLKEYNLAAQEGKPLFIGSTPWNIGAGPAGVDRMVAYVNNNRYILVEEAVPLFRAMTQPNARNFCYDSMYAANISEVEILRTQPIIYIDGI